MDKANTYKKHDWTSNKKNPKELCNSFNINVFQVQLTRWLPQKNRGKHDTGENKSRRGETISSKGKVIKVQEISWLTFKMGENNNILPYLLSGDLEMGQLIKYFNAQSTVLGINKMTDWPWFFTFNIKRRRIKQFYLSNRPVQGINNVNDSSHLWFNTQRKCIKQFLPFQQGSTGH